MSIFTVIAKEEASLNSVYSIDLPGLVWDEAKILEMLSHRDRPENSKRIKQDSSEFAGTTGKIQILFKRELPLSEIKTTAKNLREIYKEAKAREKEERDKATELKQEALIEKAKKALARKK